MKRCPECYEPYKDSEKFCELDGQQLLPDPTTFPHEASESVQLPEPATRKAVTIQLSNQRAAWFMGSGGVLLGIMACVGGYLAYAFFGNEDSGYKEADTSAIASQSQATIQTSRPQAPRPDPSILEEAEATTTEAEASPEPTTSPIEEPVAVAARLNQGPVSTGQRNKVGDEVPAVQTVIQMNDGTSLEVDAAWEDQQGVWYRRGGMVAFLDSQRVRAIIGRAAQKSVPGATQ